MSTVCTDLLNSGSFPRSNKAECVVIFEGLNSEISSSILRPILLAENQQEYRSDLLWKSSPVPNSNIQGWKFKCISVLASNVFISFTPFYWDLVHSLLNPDPQLVVISSRASGRTPSLWKLSIKISPCLLESLLPSLFNKSGRCPKVGGFHPRALYMRRCLEVEMIHSDPRNTWLILMWWSSTILARW